MPRAWTLAALLTTSAPPLNAQAAPAQAPADTAPDAVVQRFVDAANARDAAAMSALVAPGAVFQRFPGGALVAAGRDSVHALYARILPRLSPEFRITVQPRIVEGNLVIDQEHFAGTPAEQGRATWMYQVRGGLIQRAWVLDGDAAAMAAPAHAQEPASTDSAAVAQVVVAFHTALATGDSAAALQLLAPDLRVLESGHIEDLDEYRAHHLAADIAFATAVPSERQIRAVSVTDSVAWLSATSRTTGTYGGRAIDSDGAELVVLTRAPDGWRIRAIHWSSRTRRRE